MVDIPLRNQEFAGRALRRIKIAGRALVVGVHRNGEVLVPHGETVLQRGDVLVVVGNPEALREARRQLDPIRA
jgi:Trk K+ transport system NAD-binding subunit